MLVVDDFDRFFAAVHGVEPFPWQKRLLRHVVENGRWPEVLDLPTGSGKTAAMDVAVFHLALELQKGGARNAPVRIAFVVDRRLIVDDAFTRAVRLQNALMQQTTGVVAEVADLLKRLGQSDSPPLIARRLRGGLPREDDWARTPAQPTILCSTVDQVGSRILFRGYGVADTMKPIHAGLLGADCLILLDEAHLAEPFRQTLHWVELYRGEKWRSSKYASPWGVCLLTATPDSAYAQSFTLSEADYQHPELARRLRASKPVRLIEIKRKGKQSAQQQADDDDAVDLQGRVRALSSEVRKALEHFRDSSAGSICPAIGVVVNRVARARAVYEQLANDVQGADVDLLIGPRRPADGEEQLARLAELRTGASRNLDKPYILVATQCVEAGVDIDFDALITELAPLDSLRQRFGRLNRGGREIVPFAAILAFPPDLSARFKDVVYGDALKSAWRVLEENSTDCDGERIIDFGILAFNAPIPADAVTEKSDAPILLPAYVDLLVQTSPIPAADPDVGVFLHGPQREPDSVNVVWRADLEIDFPDDVVRRLLLLAPPKSGEAIALPLWVVRRWLGRRSDSTLNRLADIASAGPDEVEIRSSEAKAFRWKGDSDESRWITPAELRSGDTIVVPSVYGGADKFGWNPQSTVPVADVAAKAARPYARQRYAVRVAPGLVGSITRQDLARALAQVASRDAKRVREALLDLALGEDVRADLMLLDRAKGRVYAYLDAYPSEGEHAGGVVFVAPLGLDLESDDAFDTGAAATEDDNAGSATGYAVRLTTHSEDVARMAAAFAAAAGLDEDRQADIRVAGHLHDIGKVDPRFQSWLYCGDPFGPDPDDANEVIAKSSRPLPRSARKQSGLPERWRHEVFSVRLAPLAGEFSKARDPELVLWLIGTHHGHGRPLYPHDDPADAVARTIPPVFGLPPAVPAGTGPQALDYFWDGVDWSELQRRLQARYGIWELARMEAILRLADHRASEFEKEESR